MSARSASRLALGTAQFGLPYGLEKPSRPVEREAAAEILATAWQEGIDLLDTAAVYGNAESVIGELRPPEARFAIISKTIPVRDRAIDAAAIRRLRDGVFASISRLRVKALDVLVVHYAPDLLAPGGAALFRMLEALRGDGVVRRIGVSIYDAATLQAVLAAYPIEIVQLPINVLDQRLLRDGTLAGLAARGIEVHARSIFLQGVLLMEPDQLPARFGKILPRLRQFRAEAGKAGLSPSGAALGYVARCPGVTRLVIGVNSALQLRENLAALEGAMAAATAFDAAPYATDDRDIVDPRSWAA